MSIVSSQTVRAEGVELREEIDRHAKAMYDRIEREEQKLLEELQQLRRLKDRFAWVGPPVEPASNQAKGLESQRRAIGMVSSNQGGTGGRSDG